MMKRLQSVKNDLVSLFPLSVVVGESHISVIAKIS
jgi:hypothetical protein